MLCVLPMLCAALLFSEAGGDVGTGCLPAVSPVVKRGRRGLHPCLQSKITSSSAMFSNVLHHGQKGPTRKAVVFVVSFFSKPLAWEKE